MLSVCKRHLQGAESKDGSKCQQGGKGKHKGTPEGHSISKGILKPVPGWSTSRHHSGHFAIYPWHQ